MGTVDWAAIENPALNRNRRMYDNCRIDFDRSWVDDRTKPKGDGTFEQKKKDICIVYNPATSDKTAVPIDTMFLEQYGREYKAWQEGAPIPISGTPLVNWSQMPRAIYEEVLRLGFETLEQISEEGAKMKLGPLASWGKKAKDFLKSAGSTQAQVAALTEALEAANKKIEHYEAQIGQMQTRITQAGI